MFLQVPRASAIERKEKLWITLAVGTDVMWKLLREVRCPPVLGSWQGRSALKLQTGNTSHYLKKKDIAR